MVKRNGRRIRPVSHDPRWRRVRSKIGKPSKCKINQRIVETNSRELLSVAKLSRRLAVASDIRLSVVLYALGCQE
eukprot:scaffold871_cov130-Cylindrotheca_fusiformis.AAC.16